MTSILDQTSSIASHQRTHHCGGTVLSGPDHVYCDRCEAVAYYGEDMDCVDWDEAMSRLAEMGEGESNLDD